MTYIEFFDRKAAADNILSSLACPPERVILVGDRMKQMKKHALRYGEIFAARGVSVDFSCCMINDTDLSELVSSLSEIVDSCDECLFDLTGGEDLYLVAVGMVREKYPEKNIHMRYCRAKTGEIIEFGKDGERAVSPADFSLTVEENIRAYGGRIIRNEVRENGTVDWDFTGDFRDDIAAMWAICANDVRNWNAQIGVLDVVNTLSVEDGTSLVITASTELVRSTLERMDARYIHRRDILDSLYQAGLLTYYEFGDSFVTLTFKNEQVKRCLTKAGLALELFFFLAVRDARNDGGEAIYGDTVNGVYIDWDGEIHTDPSSYDTENEIDIMAMHGAIPVFISCKNGYIDMDELYKLSTVADRFGGRYAKKVLVATCLDPDSDFGRHLIRRATDMGIRVVYDVLTMSDEKLYKTVKSLWSN